MVKLFYYLISILITTLVTIAILIFISLTYNYVNNISPKYSIDFSKIYGEQEKQLLVRQESLRNNKQRATNEIIAIGGSTTWGSAMMPNGKTIMPINETWPSILEDRINANRGRSQLVSNLGIVGASTSCSLNAIKYFDLKNSKYLIVHNGYNDLPILLKENLDDYIFLNTSNKVGFCMYSSFFNKFTYDITRLLIHNFPILNNLFSKNLVNGSSDIYLGYELTSNDKVINVDRIELNKFINNNINDFIENTKHIIDFSKRNNLKVLFIIEPEIEPSYTPNGSSFRNKSSVKLLRDIHIKQQDALIDLIIRLNDQNLKYLDVRANFRNKPEYFYDEIHLNAIGNAKLSDLIINSFNENGW